MTDTLRVSYSSLGTFSSCPRKFEFDKMYPRRVRDGDNYAADVGKALHTGYQDYLIHGDKEHAIWSFMRAFPYMGEFQQSNDYRSFEAALATLELMFEDIKIGEYELAQIKRPLNQDEQAYYAKVCLDSPEARDAIPDRIVVPAIEVPFEIRFEGITIPPCRRFPDGAGISVIGYIDAIMRNYSTGLFRTLDIKTSRMNLKDSTAKFRYDTQQVPYGIVVDHVAQGAVEAFEVLYLECYVDIVEPRVQLYPFLKRQTDIQEWATTKVLQFQQIARFASMDFFPRTDNGCLFYNSPCRYLEPCQSRDAESLTEWFLLGQEPAKEETFEPWIVASVNLGEG